MKSTPTRGVKQYLKPNAYNQSELDWTLMTICCINVNQRITEDSMSDLAFVTDGTFAVIVSSSGLIDMGVNHCPNEGCLAKTRFSPIRGFHLAKRFSRKLGRRRIAFAGKRGMHMARFS